MFNTTKNVRNRGKSEDEKISSPSTTGDFFCLII